MDADTQSQIMAEGIKQEKIRRAMLSGPSCVTSEATVAELETDGSMTVLRPGTNEWICMVMFAGTPYAHLHICGSPWDGNEYHPGDHGAWTMTYARP
jgi:hypothetical protein